MSKKKRAKKSKPAPPKPRRVKCPECGFEYDEGAPHAMFCQGPDPLGPCDICGEESRDNFKCTDCESISCSRGGDPDVKLCADCLGIDHG